MQVGKDVLVRIAWIIPVISSRCIVVDGCPGTRWLRPEPALLWHAYGLLMFVLQMGNATSMLY